MANNRQRNIARHYRELVDQELEDPLNANLNLRLVPNGDDLERGYALLTGYTGEYDEFVGGEYIVKFSLAKKYVKGNGPPDFVALLTPNGVFKAGSNICVSTGTFHANDHKRAHRGGSWIRGSNDARRLAGFLSDLLGGMLDPNPNWSGIGIISPYGRGGGPTGEYTKAKRKFAKASKEYNRRKYPRVIQMFEDYDRMAPWTQIATMFPLLPEDELARLRAAALPEIAAERRRRAQKRAAASAPKVEVQKTGDATVDALAGMLAGMGVSLPVAAAPDPAAPEPPASAAPAPEAAAATEAAAVTSEAPPDPLAAYLTDVFG